MDLDDFDETGAHKADLAAGAGRVKLRSLSSSPPPHLLPNETQTPDR